MNAHPIRPTRSLKLVSMLVVVSLILLVVPTLSGSAAADLPEFLGDALQKVASVRPAAVAEVPKVEDFAQQSSEATETADVEPLAPDMQTPVATSMLEDEELATIGVKGERRYTGAKAMLDKINAKRVANGRSKLTMNAAYLEPAMHVAAEISIDFDDYYFLRPNCEDFLDIYPAPWIGMAFGYANTSSPQIMYDYLMSDYDTRAMLLDSSAKSVGIGCFKLNGFYYWTIYVSTAKSAAATMPANKVVTAPIQIYTPNLKLFALPKTISIVETKTGSIAPYATVPNWSKLPISKSYVYFYPWPTDIAKVNTSGTITGKKPGTAYINFCPKDNGWIEGFSIATITPIKYTIKFYNGTTLLKTLSIARGKTMPTSPAPAKTGYNFVGWYTAASGGTLVEKVTKNQSVYARYKAKQFTITYYNGTELFAEKVQSYGKAPIAGPAKTGYTFVGWFTAQSGGTQVTKISKAQTLYARFKIKQYTTNYYNGATLYKTVKANYKTPLIKGPAKTGYTFVGWFNAKTGGTQYTEVTGNRTLYARYKIKYYTVNFYEGTDLLATESIKYKGAPITAPAKVGYNFAGWFTAPTGGTQVTAITKSQDLYARYTIKKFTVNYYNGATLIKTVTQNYGAAPIAGPAKTGYTFEGWFTAKTGGVQVTEILKSQTLYARYVKNP